MPVPMNFRAIAIVVVAVLACALSVSDATAQTRAFDCGKGQAITLNVTGSNSIWAGPIKGGMLRLQNSPGNPMQFTNGGYSVTISSDQMRIEVAIPDFGVTKCTFQQHAAAPNQPGVGNTGPCGPGYRQAPGTQRCDPMPGMAAPPQQESAAGQRASDPCPPGFRQAPETDRCDPITAARPSRAAPSPGALAAGRLPMGGRSLGGIMRAGPSQSAARVASIGEGNELMILERGPMWDGYSWFRVQYQRRTGYIWGGILCSLNPLGGIYQQCAP